MIEKVFIIHRSVVIEREKYVNNLISNFPNYEIIEPIIPENLNNYGGKRKSLKNRNSELSLTLTNLSIYENIVRNKLNNVIIFEDDAIQVAPIPQLDLDNYAIYLHKFRHPHQKENEIYDCQAMFYPTWQNTEKLLNLIKSEPKLLVIDNQLQKIKETYKLHDKLIQLDEMIFIQAPGKSSVVDYYFNNRYKKYSQDE